MSKVVTGGCKCGAVRYRGWRASVPSFRCHCRDCQQLTGAGHSEMMPLEAETFEIDDTCKIYQMIGGSGHPTYSGFCPNCGSQLFRKSDRMSDWVYVHAGSLDDPSHYVPERSIYPESAQDWDDGIVVPDN